jgi:hemolysin activation/secretion protein
VMRVQGVAEFRPIPKIMFSLAPRAQYSPTTLLSYEQFSAGNYTVGRGFDPGTLIGDSGVGVRLEAGVGSIVPDTPRSLTFLGYAFLDAAWVWSRDAAPGVRNLQKLQSAGGGVRVAFGDRFLFDAVVAVPFDKAGLQTTRGDTRLLVSITTRLFPPDRR